MRTLKQKDVEFTLEATVDDLDIRGNCSASGDHELDKRAENELINRVNDGDIWAWASVKVTAKWEGLEGVDYLGGCSYKDEDDFKKGGYYQDIKDMALEDLNKQIKAFNEKLEVLR